MKLSFDQRAALARHLLSRFRMVAREKVGAHVEVVAAVFDVADLFGAGVPSGDDFVTRYWTTIGPVVFAPPGRTEQLGEHLRILSHEVGHGVQFWRDHVAYLGRYLTPRGRAELEAEAERGACEVWWILTGAIPGDLGAVDICRHGYALKTRPGEHDDHADLTRDLLEQAVTSIRAGVISTDVGLAVLGWMNTYAPDAIVGRVVQ